MGLTAVAAALFVSTAQAGLILDLRVASGGDAGNPSKEITVSANGQVVQLNLYGVVTGTNNTDDEAMLNAYARIISSNNTADSRFTTGAFSQASIQSPFNTGPFQAGTLTDIDGDGDLDLGGTTNTTYVFARADPTAGTPAGNRASSTAGNDREEFLLGTLTWTVGQLGSIDTLLSSIKPSTGIAPVANYTNDNGSGTAANVSAGSAVTVHVSVPEPASLGVLSLGLLGILARRR